MGTDLSARVAELWRYPVKSMEGERVAGIELDERGVVGDRTWAVRDEVRGGIRGAKKIGGLMRFRARALATPTAAEPVVAAEITLPDGGTVHTDDPDVAARLSRALEHPVTLWPLRPAGDLDHYRRGAPDSDDLLAELRSMFGRTEDEPLPDLSVFPPELMEFESPPGAYYDAFPLLLLTTASLRALAAAAPGSVIDVRRFRPSVLLEADGDRPVELGWVGRSASLGGAEVEVVTPCPRCVMITRAVADLPADRGLMRVVVREFGQDLGVYARVVAGGEVREGDPLVVH